MKILIAISLALMVYTASVDVSHAQQPFRWIQSDVDLYNLEVIKVDGRRLTVRVFELDGRRTFRVPSNFNFYLDGTPTDVTQLRPRQRLTAYVTRGAGGKLQLVDAGPPAATPPVTPVRTPIIAVQAPPVMATSLPKTASIVPLIGLGGLAFAMLGFGISLIRRRA